MEHNDYEIVVDVRHYRVEKILKILGLPNVRISKMTPEEQNALDDALANIDTATLVIEMDKAGFKMKDEPIPTKTRGLSELMEYRDKEVGPLEKTKAEVIENIHKLNLMLANLYGYPPSLEFADALIDLGYIEPPTSDGTSLTAVNIIADRQKKKLRLRTLMAELLILTDVTFIGGSTTIDNMRSRHDARNAIVEKMAEFNKAAEEAEYFGQSIFPIGGL